MMGHSKKNSAAAELDSLHSVDQTADSFLENKNDLVYELVEEDEAIIENSHAEQIKQLQHTQKSIRHQLDDAFLDIDKLTRQFKKEKKTRQASLTSYIALMMAGIAFIIALGAVYFLSNSQEKVDTLARSIETLNDHNHTQTGESVHNQLEDLQLKVDNILDQQQSLASTNTAATGDDIAAKKNTSEDPLTFTGSGIPATTETTVTPSVDTKTTSMPEVKVEPPVSETVVIEADKVVDDKKETVIKTPFGATTTDVSTSKTNDLLPKLPKIDASAVKEAVDVKNETPVDSLKAIEPASSALTTSLLPAGTPSTNALNDKKTITGDGSTQTSTNASTEIETGTETETESPSLSDTLLKQEIAEPSASDAHKTTDASVLKIEIPNSKKETETETNALKLTDPSAEKPVSLSDTLLKQKKPVTTSTDEKVPTAEEIKTTSETEKDATEKAPETDKKENPPEASTLIKNGWTVILGSYKNLSRAQRSMNIYNRAGFTTSIAKIRSGGRSWHQISTNLFRTKKEAKQYLRQIKGKVKIKSSMIIHR